MISGTQTLVISGTGSSWYQEPESALSACAANEICAPNLSNIDSFGILLTNRAFFHIVNKRTASVLGRAQTVAFFDPDKRISRLAHLPFERTPKQSCVPGTEAGSLDRALAEVGRKERKGLTGLFGFVGFGCPTLHREMPKITGISCLMAASARSRDSAPMRSICRVAGVTKPQPTPFLKTQSFAVQLIIFFRSLPHGCICVPASRQTLTIHKIRRVVSRNHSRKNRKWTR